MALGRICQNDEANICLPHTEVCQNCGVVYTMFMTEYAKILVKFSSIVQLCSNMLRIWHKYATIVARSAWITYCLHVELVSFPCQTTMVILTGSVVSLTHVDHGLLSTHSLPFEIPWTRHGQGRPSIRLYHQDLGLFITPIIVTMSYFNNVNFYFSVSGTFVIDINAT